MITFTESDLRKMEDCKLDAVLIRTQQIMLHEKLLAIKSEAAGSAYIADMMLSIADVEEIDVAAVAVQITMYAAAIQITMYAADWERVDSYA